jgi:hypothetical protein
MIHVTPRAYQLTWSVVGFVFIAGWAIFGLFGGPRWLLIGLLAYVPVVPAAVAIVVRRQEPPSGG